MVIDIVYECDSSMFVGGANLTNQTSFILIVWGEALVCIAYIPAR